MNQLSNLLSTDAAAKVLNVSASWLNKQRVLGVGAPYIKLGARVCYHPGDLEDYIAKQRRISTSQSALQTAVH